MFHVDPASLDTRPAPAEGADARALIERQVAALSELAEIGMEIARAAGKAATAGPADDAAQGDPTLAYTRAARAVRLTFALQAQLLKDLAEAEAAEAKQTYNRMVRRRLHLVRLVEDGLKVEHDLDPRTAGRFADDVRERLREADEDERLLGLSFAEVLAQICADLQLSPERTAQVMAAAALPFPSASGGAPQARRPEDPASATEPLAFIEGGAAGSSGLRCAPPEDDGGTEDTFLEWPPPS